MLHVPGLDGVLVDVCVPGWVLSLVAGSVRTSYLTAAVACVFSSPSKKSFIGESRAFSDGRRNTIRPRWRVYSSWPALAGSAAITGGPASY